MHVPRSILFLAGALLAYAGGHTLSDGWANLKHVTRDSLYVVLLRDGTCEFGTLSSVGTQYIVLAQDSALGLAIKRSHIARISDNLSDPGKSAIFSSRSSWADVKTAAPSGSEYLRIVTKTGSEWNWKQPVVTDDSVSADGITLAKSRIREIFHVRSKPLNIDEKYFGPQIDLKWLGSIPWLGDRLPTKISVRLYDSAAPEDNSPLRCHY